MNILAFRFQKNRNSGGNERHEKINVTPVQQARTIQFGNKREIFNGCQSTSVNYFVYSIFYSKFMGIGSETSIYTWRSIFKRLHFAYLYSLNVFRVYTPPPTRRWTRCENLDALRFKATPSYRYYFLYVDIYVTSNRGRTYRRVTTFESVHNFVMLCLPCHGINKIINIGVSK